MTTLTLTRTQANSAEKIQHAINQVYKRGGGRVVLPAMDVTLDRGIELLSNVELAGQGEKTILRKGPGRIYPLTGYHNYGMCDVPLKTTKGLKVGMTVSVYDNLRRGFYETFARITWIDGQWVGLDHGIEGDYVQTENPRLTTAYPLIFGHRIARAAVKNVCIEGERENQDTGMGSCRGGAIYFYQSRDIEVSGVRERNYHGEGLSFQMCRDVRILDSQFDENDGNGLHPGAGSTNCLFEDCRGMRNRRNGFFFCVRANHITVRNCTFERNALGISIGARDCYNLMESCRITHNDEAGILIRESAKPCEVHSILIRDCHIEANKARHGKAQIDVLSDAHDIVVTGNRIHGGHRKRTPGIFVQSTAKRIACIDNRFENCTRDVLAMPKSLAKKPARIECGYGKWGASRFRHLAA